ncbi:6-hydroxymethylpterin diphosphokinase MptE-like protein [Campylobacterota bacterium DY0563]
MSKTQEQIEQELVSRYVNNLEFFKSSSPELFNKVELLSTAINEGLYKERYALEYIKEVQDFDILDLESNIYLYDKNFSSFNKQIVTNMDLEKEKSSFSFNKNIYKISADSYFLPDTKFELLDEYLSRDISAVKSVFIDINSSNKYKYIDKMIFLGTLLGGHIESSIKRINPKLVFIVEPNLELFRLSLFITDYKKLSQTTHFIFSIMDEESIFIKKLDLFISEYFQFSNYNIKYSKLNSFPDMILNQVLTKLHLENPFVFDYTKVLYDTFYYICKHINKYNILTLNKESKLSSSFFKNKPVLFLGAGPSLSKNIDWIRENQNNFIIVAMGAVYKKLFESGIKVDIVTTADSQYEILDKTHFNEEDVLLLKDTIILASIATPTKILNRFNQDKLFLFETYQSIKDNSSAYNGASIGEVTLNILLDLSVESIYMIGIDLSIDEKSGSSHYDGYINKRESLDDDLQLNEYLKTGKKGSREDFFEVKGVIKEKVITTRIFSFSITKYEELILKFKKDNQQIFNLSPDAAHINGVTFLEKEKLKLNKLEFDNELFTFIQKNSEFGLSFSEQENINNRLKNIEQLHRYVLNLFANNKAKNMPQFVNNIYEIFKEIINTNDYICSNLLANYFKVILPYIYYILNDEKIKPKVISKKVESIQKVLEKQLNKLFITYITYLSLVKEKTE